MSNGQSDVHVDDVGTTYRDEIRDFGSPFNFTIATAMKYIFKCPTVGIIIRDAMLYTDGVGPTQRWCLQYIVTQADVDAGLQARPGKYKRQGYLEIPTGQRYHTSIIEYEVDKNLTEETLQDLGILIIEGVGMGEGF